MSVHYKFKSALEYDTVTFDGLHISVKDLKNSILQQKRIGKSTDFDLQVTNAQTKEVYEDENALIPKNTSLLIARIPVLTPKNKPWEGYGGDNTPPPKIDEGGPIAKAVDLSSLDAPEDDKIKAMMSQSTQDYDPSNYIKIRGANQMGTVPSNYKCYKCHQGGHWIKDCTFGQGPDPIEIKKSTGIPRDFLVPVEGPQIQGAMMTPTGHYAVPILDLQAYNQKMAPAPVPEPKPDIPEDLLCSICTDLLTDAVMIPCCGNSFCDECIRGELLESEDHECPDCHEKDISPETLIPNRFLRKAVANFKNTTGYIKKPTFREKPLPQPKITSTVEESPPQEPESTDKQADERTVISEADSTEHSKSDQNEDSSKENVTNDITKPPDSSEGPPGVSPKNSPKERRRHKERDERSRSKDRELESRERIRRRSRSRERSRGASPRKNSHHLRSPKSPSYNSPISRIDDRSGTPTVDEPTTANGSYKTIDATYNSSAPPGTVPSIMDSVSAIQGPPQNIPTTTTFPPNPPPIGTYPPNQGPPPNYRMPPPGAAPYLQPGPYPIPPRPLFDAVRPPLGGVPPNFNFTPSSRGHRDFRRMRDRTPPGVIDDPLAAFNRMLREKDERKRRAKRRSYSRSRSRSRSFSRSPVRRRSRSPRPRRSRSRSRSFSLSRSRSRSYSASPRGSPYRRSPPPARRGHSRYKSPPPARSPLRRHRSREFDEDRDFNREDRYKDRNRNRTSRDRRSSRDRDDRDRYYDNYDRRGGTNFDDRRRPTQQWGGQQGPGPGPGPGPGYFPPMSDMQSGFQNRFTQGPPRDYGPPFMNKEPPYNQPLPQTIHSIQAQRQFQDIHPPGVDDDIAPPGVDEVVPPKPLEKRDSPKKEERDKPDRKERDRRDKERERSVERKRKHERRSRTPDRARNPSPKRRSRSRDSTDRRRKKRRESSERDDRKKEDSEDEKSKKTKDKKKHKDKKESEKKKKRDKKEKHKKDSKEKKPKEEFRQVIPRNVETDDGSSAEDAELMEKKRLDEEKRLEEKRMESLREQKVKDEEKVKADGDERQHKEEHDGSKKTEKVHNEKDVEKVKIVREEEKMKKSRDDIKSRKVKDDEKNRRHKHDDKYIKPKEGDKLKAKEEKNIREEKHSTKTEICDLEEPKPELYDILTEVDAQVIENYGKLEDQSFENISIEVKETLSEEQMEEGEIKEFDDEEKDVLELHSDDMDLKTEIDKSDILAPVPEKSKWEVDEDVLTSPKDHIKIDSKSDKSGKVTNEVLKRAENAIFAKAINAIRPIEIKKISTDRAKLYSSEREVERSHNKIQVTVPSAAIDLSNDKPAQPPVRLSVKERLGVKVEDTDKVINLERNRSRTVSPFSRRGDSGRNFDPGDRRVELEFRNRRDRNRRSRTRSRDRRRDNRHHIRIERQRSDNRRERSKNKEKTKYEDDNKKTKKKRSRSRSESEDRKHKKKDRKQKKEKAKKKDDEKGERNEKEENKATVVSKRKTTIDEANFEPDYDLESHSDEEKSNMKKAAKKHSDGDDDDDDDKKSSTSESESSSSSEEERTRKKHRKHKKKKRKESSSSSSSESESESSDSDSKRKRKKHKKTKKKKKKSKHK